MYSAKPDRAIRDEAVAIRKHACLLKSAVDGRTYGLRVTDQQARMLHSMRDAPMHELDIDRCYMQNYVVNSLILAGVTIYELRTWSLDQKKRLRTMPTWLLADSFKLCPVEEAEKYPSPICLPCDDTRGFRTAIPSMKYMLAGWMLATDQQRAEILALIDGDREERYGNLIRAHKATGAVDPVHAEDFLLNLTGPQRYHQVHRKPPVRNKQAVDMLFSLAPTDVDDIIAQLRKVPVHASRVA